jgi:hypothetical protein
MRFEVDLRKMGTPAWGRVFSLRDDGRSIERRQKIDAADVLRL